MTAPNQLGKFNFHTLQPDEQTFMSQLIDTINTLAGHNGPVTLSDHLDLAGNRVTNIGAPVTATDAISHGVAQGSYSAAALKPKLQAGSSQPLDTYRILNSGSQREQTSSWLTALMSTSPSANTIYPTLTVSGGSVQSVIPSSPFTFSDGSTILMNGRTDLLSIPAQFALTSISATGNVVTAVFSYTGTPPAIASGNAGTITGVSVTGFNGTFTLISVVIDPIGLTVTVQYQDSQASGSGTGGYFQLNGVWYYTAKKNNNDIYLLGPYASDSSQNRLNANYDGYAIVAVVVITNSGGQVASSGGGGSAIVGSPTAGCFF